MHQFVRNSACNRPAISMTELLIVVAMMGLLAAILLPSLSASRKAGMGVKCLANLRTIAGLVRSYSESHDDIVAPVLWEKDTFWGHGEQVGWDVQTGRWSRLPAELLTLWQCSVQKLPYTGNSRALGVDGRFVTPPRRSYPVNTNLWYEPTRLILAYDVQPSMVGRAFWINSGLPNVADISDETDGRWIGNSGSARPVLSTEPGERGPHARGAFGMAFGDGRAAEYSQYSPDFVFWSGPRWWPLDIGSDHMSD